MEVDHNVPSRVPQGKSSSSFLFPHAGPIDEHLDRELALESCSLSAYLGPEKLQHELLLRTFGRHEVSTVHHQANMNDASQRLSRGLDHTDCTMYTVTRQGTSHEQQRERMR